MPIGDTIRYQNQHRYEEQLRALFREAVAVRLQTESPVLAELSGGLDSSSVVCMANHLMRSGAVSASRLESVGFTWRNSLDEPFIREVESHCGIEGVRISTHDVPLISESQVGSAIPEAFQPLLRSVAATARRLGARTILTGQNGDLMMGNWFDDSLQVAASLRRFRIGRACEEALAWSKILRLPDLPGSLACRSGGASASHSHPPRYTQPKTVHTRQKALRRLLSLGLLIAQVFPNRQAFSQMTGCRRRRNAGSISTLSMALELRRYNRPNRYSTWIIRTHSATGRSSSFS